MVVRAAVASLLFGVVAAGGDPPTPRTVITPILHMGDPAPGIPNATMVYLLKPQIDAVGNVLIKGYFRYDDDQSTHTGIWYGGADALELIAYEEMQAPDLPPGVVFAFLPTGRLSETGWIGFSASLSGPGIIPGVNDKANFVGPPDDIRKVLQGGDPAPGLEPGTVIDVSEGLGLTAWQSDNGTLLLIAWLSGPEVDETNDKATWIGTRDDLELIWRRGMDAPGTEPGVTFKWADIWRFNDAGQIAIRAGLTGDPINESNDAGKWLGAPGELGLVARNGDPVPGFPPGVTFVISTGGLTTLNGAGDTTVLGLIEGPGITQDNALVLFASDGNGLQLLVQEGDPAPEAGPEVEIASFSEGIIGGSGHIFYQVKYRGDPIDDSNAWAMYFGPFDDARLTLRDGDRAPHLPPGTVLTRVGAVPGLAAMNDIGDVVAPSEIAGPDVTEDDNVVVWVRDYIRQDWFLLLRSGSEIGGRVVSLEDLYNAYGNKTGGSDGQAQSFSDDGILAAKIDFTDGTHGVFLFGHAWVGDGDRDRDVDLEDFAIFEGCRAGPGIPVDPEICGTMDGDGDGDVDFADFALFQRGFTGSY